MKTSVGLLCLVMLASACGSGGSDLGTASAPPPVPSSPTVPSSPPPTATSSDNYSGVYTLTITAGSCTPGFPEAAKQRVYSARVEQTGTNLRVSLSGAEFLISSGSFAGVIMPTGEIKFTIRPEFVWDYDAFDLIERMSDGTQLIVSGNIIAKRAAAGISGIGDTDLFPTGNAGEIRLNSQSLERCPIDGFELVSR